MTPLKPAARNATACAISYTENDTSNPPQRKITIKPVPVFTDAEIKGIRAKVGMTQTIFAELLGVSKRTVEA